MEGFILLSEYMDKEKNNLKKYNLNNGDTLFFCHEGFLYFKKFENKEILFKNISQIYFVKSNKTHGIASFFDKNFEHHFIIFRLDTQKIVYHLNNTRVKIAHLSNNSDNCFVGINQMLPSKKKEIQILKINISSQKQELLYSDLTENSITLISMSQPYDDVIIFSFSSSFLTTTILLTGSLSKKIDQYPIDSKRYFLVDGKVFCISLKDKNIFLFREGVSFNVYTELDAKSYIKNCIHLDQYILIHIGNVWNDLLLVFTQETHKLILSTSSEKGGYFENISVSPDGIYFSERHLLFFKKYHIGLDKKIELVHSKTLLDSSIYNFSIEEGSGTLPDFSLIQNKSVNDNLLVCVYGNHRMNDAMLTYSSFIRDWVEKGGAATYLKTEGDVTLQKDSYEKSIDQISTAIDYFSKKGFKITLLGVSAGGTTVLDFSSRQKNYNIAQAYSLIPYLGSWFYGASNNRIVVPEHIPVSLNLNTSNIDYPLVVVSAEYDDRCLEADISIMKNNLQNKHNFVLFETIKNANHLNFIEYYNNIK